MSELFAVIEAAFMVFGMAFTVVFLALAVGAFVVGDDLGER